MKTSQHFLSKTFLVVLIVGFVSSCSYDDVELHGIEDFDIEKIDSKGAEVTGKIKIENPNGYKIKVTSSDADLYLNDTYGGKAELMSPILIPANFNGLVEARIRADFDQGSVSLLPIVLSATLKKSIQIDIKGTLRAKSFLFSQKIDFEVSEKASF